MAVLRFTSAGVVGAPTTLQVRLSRELPGRIPAGAPDPDRPISNDELLDNLRYFTVVRSGPRVRPCTTLVLSGVRLGQREGLAPVLAQGAAWGMERVVLHLGRGERDALRSSPVRERVHEVVISVERDLDLADVAALIRSGVAVVVALPLSQAGLSRLDAFARALVSLAPARVVLTWPLAGEPPPHAARVAQALRAPTAALDRAGIGVSIKGLPLCGLGPAGRFVHRTRNRFYVDAAHQREHALLFFPEVLRFVRPDPCRFCAVASDCDGAPARWLQEGLAGPIRPVTTPP
ncbi:MAG: hypothetical protein EA397_19500 [Deltaproteobacteria bacterium]|nr:MAG: hypothetical protein EA397_19500 [Deltaproteobacteria bacterium]